MKKILAFVVFTFILFFSLFRIHDAARNDFLPEKENVMQSFKTLAYTSKNEGWEVGWSQQNITPQHPVRMVGKGWRKKFETVHDSLMVHVLLLKNEDIKIAWISFDLLLITPTLYQDIQELAKTQGIDAVYLSASHSHSSFGGYGHTEVEKLILGGYEETVYQRIISQTEIAFYEALHQLQALKSLNYCQAKGAQVIHRINDKEVSQAPLISLKWETTNNRTFELLNFSAHPTILSGKTTALSNDYPYWLTQSADANMSKMFMAGPMGSCSPFSNPNLSGFEKAKQYAASVAAETPKCEVIHLDGAVSFKTLTLQPIHSAARIFAPFELRPIFQQWLWNNNALHIDVVGIGNVLMISLPCELSYVYYDALLDYAASKKLHLILTIFNGDYAGYCPDKLSFSTEHRETRYMNWLGENAGSYFEKLIRKIIDKENESR